MKTLQLRLTNLSENMKVHVDKKQIYIDAWIAKKFLVLLKRKLRFPGNGGSESSWPQSSLITLGVGIVMVTILPRLVGIWQKKKKQTTKGINPVLVLFWGKMHQKNADHTCIFFGPDYMQ